MFSSFTPGGGRSATSSRWPADGSKRWGNSFKNFFCWVKYLKINRSTKPKKSSRRFADLNGNCKRTFELHLWKDVPRLVQRYQGNCGTRITEDCFLAVKSFGTSRWTDKSEHEWSNLDRSTFEKNCLQNFDSENHDGSSQVFEYSYITVYQKCKGQLSEAKNRFLIGLGLYFQ